MDTETLILVAIAAYLAYRYGANRPQIIYTDDGEPIYITPGYNPPPTTPGEPTYTV